MKKFINASSRAALAIAAIILLQNSDEFGFFLNLSMTIGGMLLLSFWAIILHEGNK